MKTFVLTADYELFLGSRTGTVEKTMAEPTFKLAEILDINSSKMTVFWDILHYYRLTELENNFPDIKRDRKLIDDQISFLISKGHDIQLHLHPHWIDAEYSDGEWKFKYDRFRIHALSEEENPNKIDTVSGCITLSKLLMETVVSKYSPGYKVAAFRAGGYLIEPFIKLKKAFESNNIYVDSSVLPGLSNDNHVNGYDFINYPAFNYYNFTDSPSKFTKGGRFTEIPVTTINIPVIKNLLFSLLRRLKYNRLEYGRSGTGSGESAGKSNNSRFKKIYSVLTSSKQTVFTTDGNFSERFNYMCRKLNNNSTMILHPKLLNSHTLNILRDKLKNNEIRFISINNFLSDVK